MAARVVGDVLLPTWQNPCSGPNPASRSAPSWFFGVCLRLLLDDHDPPYCGRSCLIV